MASISAGHSEVGASPKVQSTLPWAASEPASWDNTAGSGNAMCTDSTEARNNMSGWEFVSSLWSVGGAVGFEVRHVLNIEGFEESAKKAAPPCGARGGKEVAVLCSRNVSRVIV